MAARLKAAVAEPVVMTEAQRIREEIGAGGLVTMREAVAVARVSRQTLYDWMARGLLKFTSAGPSRKRLILKSSLIELLASGMSA